MWMMSVPIATCAVAALDRVADGGPEPALDGGRAHAEDDQAVAAGRPRDTLDGAAEVARGEDVRQAGDEPAHRHPRLHGAAEARRGHQALPPGERHGAHARQVERDESAAPTPRASPLRPPEQAAIDELAEHVPDQDVRLLDARRVRARGHAQAEIDQAGERPAVAAGEADGLDAELPAHLDRAQYARGAAAGGDGERDVAPGAERAHLAREHLVVAVVVGDGGERRGVGGECDGGQRPPLALEPPDELRREVLRVGGATAVAEEEKLPPRAERLGDQVDGALEGVCVLLQEDLAGARARLEQRPDGRLAGARARAGRRHAGRWIVGAGPGAVKEARAGDVCCEARTSALRSRAVAGVIQW